MKLTSALDHGGHSSSLPLALKDSSMDGRLPCSDRCTCLRVKLGKHSLGFLRATDSSGFLLKAAERCSQGSAVILSVLLPSFPATGVEIWGDFFYELEMFAACFCGVLNSLAGLFFLIDQKTREHLGRQSVWKHKSERPFTPGRSIMWNSENPVS